MTALDSIEMHDALIIRMDIKYAEKVVSIDVELYTQSDRRVREKRSIVFDGVRSISQISDLNAIGKNAFAGNINYWVPGKDGSTTFIYLTDGCIAIEAQTVRVE